MNRRLAAALACVIGALAAAMLVSSRPTRPPTHVGAEAASGVSPPTGQPSRPRDGTASPEPVAGASDPPPPRILASSGTFDMAFYKEYRKQIRGEGEVVAAYDASSRVPVGTEEHRALAAQYLSGVARAYHGASGCARDVRVALTRARIRASAEVDQWLPPFVVEVKLQAIRDAKVEHFPDERWREQVEQAVGELGSVDTSEVRDAMECLPP